MSSRLSVPAIGFELQDVDEFLTYMTTYFQDNLSGLPTAMKNARRDVFIDSNSVRNTSSFYFIHESGSYLRRIVLSSDASTETVLRIKSRLTSSGYVVNKGFCSFDW